MADVPSGRWSFFSGLRKEQKIGFFLLLIFALLTIGLGALQLRNTMYGPFALNNKVPSILKDEVNNIEALRFRDTDFDELNDFDELYVYNTSPYLPDTDSDGIRDKKELEQGTNPICAEGRDCGGVVAAGDTGATSSVNTAIFVPAPELGNAPVDLLQALQDPVQIRAMLIEAGMDKSALDRISDADLMKMVAEIMNSTTTRANFQSIGNISLPTSGR